MGAKRHTRAFWRKLIAEAERTGVVEPVARRHGVRPKTLAWWRWRLEREMVAGEGQSSKLLPVMVEAASIPGTRPGVIEVVAGEVRLRVKIGSDASYVAELVAALRGRC